jgi:hypothetical protein
MPIDSRSTQQQGSAAAKAAAKKAAAKKKERRAQEAAQAMRDYEANRAAIRAKTERLRAIRLAKEAGNSTPKKTRDE